MRLSSAQFAGPRHTNYEDDEARIRESYARRDERGCESNYAWFHPDVLLSSYRFTAAAAACLRRAGWEDLSRMRALDVGCGTGRWLQQLLAWGGGRENLHGIDLLPDRIAAARELAPGLDYRVGSGWELPFSDASMDLVSAHTVFSSILDAEARLGLAREMARVLAPDGWVMIYDFRVSHPLNPDTIGITRREIRRLFPRFEQQSQSMMLAPPIARTLARVEPLLTVVLDAFCPPLRTHNMYLLHRLTSSR